VAAPARGVRLLVDSPTPSASVSAASHLAEVRGSAVAAGDAPRPFDVFLVLDVSQSTRAASGADVDGDGVVGENPQLGLHAPGEIPEDLESTDPEDTILHAEVAAARALLASLDPARVRVGLIGFSGKVDPSTGMQASRDQRDAELRVPLTGDFGRVQGALDQLLARGPHGATNFAAGLRLATTELAGLSGAVSRPRPGAQGVVLFLTDGVPSFPFGLATESDPGDVEAAVAAARLARDAGVRINTYALGMSALSRPVAATEVARVTLGTFTPVLEPGAIVAALQAVSFANVEDVGMVNLSLGGESGEVRLSPDGSFVGYVPVREGRNRVLVNAVASDGSASNLEVEFDFALARAEGRQLEQELERLRRMNAELLRTLEGERVKAEKRRQRMQREIELRVESD
jgi:hypothetical protein